MTALVITAANVVPGAGATFGNGIAGAAITAGQEVYIDVADANKVKLADADSGTAAQRVAVGTAVNNAAAGQPVCFQKTGKLAFGAILTQGTIYVLGDAAGGIMPAADLGSGDRVVIVGIAASSTVMDLVHKGFDTAAA